MSNIYKKKNESLSNQLQNHFKQKIQKKSGHECPKCKRISGDVHFDNEKFIARLDCKHPISYIVGTELENTKINVPIWDLLYWFLLHSKAKLSSRELQEFFSNGISHVSICSARTKIFSLAKDWHEGVEVVGEVEADETFIGTSAKFSRRLHKFLVQKISDEISKYTLDQVKRFSYLEKLELISKVLSEPGVKVFIDVQNAVIEMEKKRIGQNKKVKKITNNKNMKKKKEKKPITNNTYLYLFDRWIHYTTCGEKLPIPRITLPKQKRFVFTMVTRGTSLCKAIVFKRGVESMNHIHREYNTEFEQMIYEQVLLWSNVSAIYTDGQKNYESIIEKLNLDDRHYAVSHNKKEWVIYKADQNTESGVRKYGIPKVEGFNRLLKEYLNIFSRLNDKVIQIYVDFFTFRKSYPRNYKEKIFDLIVNPKKKTVH